MNRYSENNMYDSLMGETSKKQRQTRSKKAFLGMFAGVVVAVCLF